MTGPLRTVLARAATRASLLALTLPLASCSLVPGLVKPSPSADPDRTDPAVTNGPTGDPEDFSQTCTHEGRLRTNGSTLGSDPTMTHAQDEPLRFALVALEADDEGSPSAHLRVQAGDESRDLPGLHVGDTAEFEDWSLTVRSICADSVGFDAEMED